MKSLIIASLLFSGTSSFAADLCSESVESQLVKTYNLRLEQALRLDFSGSKILVYTARTNTHGGQAQLEVVVDKTTCQVVNTFTVWAE